MPEHPKQTSRTVHRQRLRTDPRITWLVDEDLDTNHERPKVRADCDHVPRPCPFVGCRFNVFLEVARSGGVSLTWPHLAPWEVPPSISCVLDVVDASCHRGKDGRGRTLPGSDYHRTLEKVGRVLGLTRERVRQIEEDAQAKIRTVLDREGVDQDDDAEG